jgi:hypothetical protein
VRLGRGGGSGRHRRDPIDTPGGEAPRGVRILHPDGTESACDVIRAPEDTPDGLALWYVVPPDGVKFNPGNGDRLAVAVLTPHTAIAFDAIAALVTAPPADLN